MKSRYVVFLAVLMLACLCGGAFATDYFVATNGNDTNPGTIGEPLATLTEAVSRCVAGDNVMVRAGSYTQHLYWDTGGNGAPGAYITIQAYDGDLSAFFVGESGATNTIDLENRQYCRVIGLDVSGAQSQGYYCVKMSGCQYVELKRCSLHDSGSGDVVKGNQGDYYTIEDNEIYRPGGDNPSGNNQGIDAGVDVDYAIYRNNYIHDFPDMAYYSKGGSEYVIAEGNVVYNQDPAWPGPAIGFGQQTDKAFMDGAVYQTYYMVQRNNIVTNCPGGAFGTYSCYHGFLYNNVMHNCGTAAENLGIICTRVTGASDKASTNGFYAYNNVFLDTRGEMPTVYRYHSGDYSDWQHDYNNFYNNGVAIPSAGMFDPNLEANSTFGHPNLANPTGSATTWQGWVDCFRITSGSTALIDEGTSAAGNDPQPAVHYDIEGTARPQGAGWDIGAFEYASGPVAPTANFSGNPTEGYVPLTVAFTDLSTGQPTSWDWTFGDSGTSQAQHPSHDYAAINTYTVSLTVQNAQGQDTETKPNYITVSDQPDQSCHVGAIDMANGGVPSYKAAATITVHDQDCAPLVGVTVAITWSGATQGTDSDVTNEYGQVTFTSGRNKSGGTFTCTVTNLTKSGYPYQSGDNHETSDSITLP